MEGECARQREQYVQRPWGMKEPDLSEEEKEVQEKKKEVQEIGKNGACHAAMHLWRGVWILF